MVDLTRYGKNIDRIHSLNQEIKYHNDKVKELEEERDLVGDETLKIMDALGTLTGKTGIARATVSETESPGFADDEALYNWIAEDPLTRIAVFQRRLHKGNWEDLVRMTGEAVPGIEPFVKRKVVVSKLPNT